MAEPPKANFSTKEGQGPPIYVTNATVVGYNHEVEYFGSDIPFKKTISLELSCTLTDITNVEGVAPGVEAFLAFLNTSQDYSLLYINGVLQEGAAKVVSFSVSEGDMVNQAVCSISFLIHATYGTLSSKLTGYYADYRAGTDADEHFGQILDSFTDSISLSRSDNSTGYSRSIAISANKSRGITDLGEKIGTFVKGVLAFGTFSFPDFGEDYESDIERLANPTNGFKKFITETSDELSNTYTFQESLQATNVASGKSYSSVITHSYSRASNGVVSVKENGALIGLLKTSRIDAAEVGYTAELAAASDRMRDFYDEVKMEDSPDLNECPGGELLFLTKGKTTNTFEGTISYSLAANNDPKYKDGNGVGKCGVKWEYNVTVESDGVYESATEQGTINGAGNIKYDANGGGEFDKYTKYLSAKTFFENKVLASSGATLNGRITTLINTDEFAVSPKPTRRTQGHAPRQGVISYSRSFSNNPIYQLNDATNRIKKIESTNTLNATVPIVHNFVSLSKPSRGRSIFSRGAPNRNIVQRQSTESLSTLASSITATAYRIPIAEERYEINRIGNIVKGKIDLFSLMDGDTAWLNSANFTFSSLNDVQFTLNTTYNKGKGAC